MLSSSRRRAAAIVVLAASTALTISACGSSSSSSPASSSMPGMNMTGATTTENVPAPAAALSVPLTDQNGRPLNLGALKGKTVVVADFLTTCQETCPMTSVNLHDVAAAVHAAGLDDQVAVLEGTVDPERDVPSRLAAYQKLYGVEPSWDLVTAGTGTPALWQAFGVKFDKTKEDDPPPKDWLTGQSLTYDIDHDDAVFVIDPTGHIRWEAHGMADTGGQKPPQEIYNFLSDEGVKNLNFPSGPSWTVGDVESALTSVTGRKV